MVCRPGELSSGERAQWRALQATATAFRHPFLSPDFAAAFDAASPTARVAVAFDGPRIVGFLPFEARGRTRARPYGGTMTNRQAFVHAPGLEWSWDELLRGAGVAFLDAPGLVAEQAQGRRTLAITPSPVIDTTVGWADYVQTTRRRKSIKTILYKDRRLQKLAEVEFRIGVAPAPWLHQLITWKSEQYRRTGRPDPFARPAARELLTILNAHEGPGLRPLFSALVVDEKLAAADFSVASPTVYAAWFAAYDRDLAAHSPGAIRTLRTIQLACELGIEQIDLARGDESYKQALKNADVDLAHGCVHRRSARAFAVRAGRAPGRALARYVLDRPRVRGAVRDGLARVGSARVRIRP